MAKFSTDYGFVDIFLHFFLFLLYIGQNYAVKYVKVQDYSVMFIYQYAIFSSS